MTHRTLIVARMDAGDEAAVADIFRESDDGQLPHMLGVVRRNLFSFHGLYFHLIEAADDVAPALPAIREHPLFVDVNTKLEKRITAYDPDTWSSPRDAMARNFYSWTAD
ncbi:MULTISPECIES: TcmI family type II polyketide cyclase [unclassified Frankia]|uniref:TcmI family type II polyketide cyclase n=1 Tax=unclassified Frankia TaxID=2632575 RepID=UPI002AD4B7A8|nr:MULTISPECIES: TcmI family type II polyketide cyclase [unclassified Frankia]